MRQSHSERLSDILKNLSETANPDMTLGDVVRALGERGFGALILVFAAPNLIPLPPGASFVFGVPLVFITAQLMIARTRSGCRSGSTRQGSAADASCICCSGSCPMWSRSKGC